MNRQPHHKKAELFDLVTSALQSSGWSVLYTAPISGNPMQIMVQRDDLSYSLRIYIWNLTHGGGTHRPRKEYRIQVTGIPSIEITPGTITLLLGWWDSEQIFAGFDASKHSGPQKLSPSIQISEEALSQAQQRGLVPYNKGNGEIAFAIRPDMLTTYIQDLATLHEIGTKPNELEAIESSVEETADDTNVLQAVAEPRREVIRSIRAKIRNAQFRQRVLSAYANSCALCLIQMELIEAAHIIPVAYPGSQDVVTNGIAMCPLHHKAFDRGLLTAYPLDGNYKVALNLREVQRLKELHLADGYEKFKSQLSPQLRLPRTPHQHPSSKYINIGNQLRGWSESDFSDPLIVEFV